MLGPDRVDLLASTTDGNLVGARVLHETAAGAMMSGRWRSMYLSYSRAVRAAVLSLTTVSIAGCLLGFPCKGIKRGLGVTAGGALAAGEHASHTLDLTHKAQNDVYVTPRDSVPTGTTYTIYVTSAIISSATLGQLAGNPVNGPGAYLNLHDHEVGGANQFKVWIIGDPRVPMSYKVQVWWASGNDC